MALKILVIGHGAREHVIAETLKRSPREPSLVCYGKSKNPGIAELCEVYELGNLTDIEHVKKFAVEQQVDFAVVGPEDPIAAGVADALATVNIPTVAPFATGARLESSKAFTRDLLVKYGIPGNPRFQVFPAVDGMAAFAESCGGNFVVKADGLRAGKGVQVSGDHFATTEEGLAYAQECVAKDGRVVLEEKFVGQEFSLMSFCDGTHTAHMPAIQDHKRAYEEDKGPNTGGMGTYSDSNLSLPFLRESDIAAAQAINQQVCDALAKETGAPFKGILYGGFMATKDGVGLIEYNARFGDPEAMNALVLLETDFVDVCEAILKGELNTVPLSFSEKATVCKYVVPQGYPDASVKDVKVTVGEIPDHVRLYYGSVDQKDDGLFLCGSRAIAVVGIGDTLEEAEKVAEKAACAITGPVFHRRDIGTAALIQKRVDMMRSLRGA